MDRSLASISDEPLRVSASAHRAVVIIETPGGTHFALTPDAAEQSLAAMAEAVSAARANGRTDGCVIVHRFQSARPLARIWQRYRQARKSPLSLRGLVAAMLCPVVFAVLLGSGLAAWLALLGDWWAAEASLVMTGLALLAALPLAWRIAPRLMASRECRPARSPRPGLHVVPAG